MTSSDRQGVLALFTDPEAILRAAAQVRDAGYRDWDVFTPFPVHGMDEAMGLPRSRVPWITFIAGALGCATALFILFGTMVYSWPGNYGGKPAAAWPSFVPITFEMTVLVGGVSTAVGALLLGGVLRNAWRSAGRADRVVLDRDITSHRFALFIASSDPKYDADQARDELRELGACQVRVLGEEEA
jgi:hypothetical protein